MLRWHTLSDTDVYTVTLDGDDELERPPVQASGGELAYPDTWPSLAGEGASYSLVVQAGERSSAEEGSGEAMPWGFSLLDPAQAAQLQSQEAKLRRTPTWRGCLDAVVGRLYLSDAYRLRSEAAELLSGAAVEDLASAQVLLGEVYLEMGLVDEAQLAFDQALVLAQQAGLPEFEAGAAFGLGTVACLRYNRRRPKATGRQRKPIRNIGDGRASADSSGQAEATQSECTRRHFYHIDGSGGRRCGDEGVSGWQSYWSPAFPGSCSAQASRLAQDDPVAQCAEGVQLYLDGRAAEAVPLLEAGFAGRDTAEFVDPDDLGLCALVLGLLLDNTGDPARALEAYAVALERFHASGNRQLEGTTLNNIGAVYAARGATPRRWRPTSRRWRSGGRWATGPMRARR